MFQFSSRFSFVDVLIFYVVLDPFLLVVGTAVLCVRCSIILLRSLTRRLLGWRPHTHTHTHAHTHTHTQNKQGKVRLSKWFSPFNQKDRARVAREVSSQILYRNPKMCNFLEWKDKKIVFRRCDAKRCCCVILLCLLSSVVRVVSSSARRRR